MYKRQHIYRLNAGLYGLEGEKESIEGRLSEHGSLIGVRTLALDRNIHNFMDLVGQLRFQQRWGDVYKRQAWSRS